MGRSLKSAEAIPSVGETRVSCAPRIYYLHPQNVGGKPDMARHIALAAGLGFDHVCLGPIFEPGRGDPFLISDLDRADPRLGIAGSPEDVVREIAALCRGQGLRLFIDIVLDRLAADGQSMRQADGLYESHHPGVAEDLLRRHAAAGAGSRATTNPDRAVVVLCRG